jgi:hypothetical protein
LYGGVRGASTDTIEDTDLEEDGINKLATLVPLLILFLKIFTVIKDEQY